MPPVEPGGPRPPENVGQSLEDMYRPVRFFRNKLEKALFMELVFAAHCMPIYLYHTHRYLNIGVHIFLES